MSKYSEEIKKQAEELIEKHAKSSIHMGWHRNWLDDSVLKKDTIPAIKAAIESCKFALEYELRFDPAWKGVRLIKQYLEELL